MEQLKRHLATLGPIDTELEALGTDANQWEFKKGAVFPVTAEVQEERKKLEQEKEKAANVNQAIKDLEEDNGPLKSQETVNGVIVYEFENGFKVVQDQIIEMGGANAKNKVIPLNTASTSATFKQYP